MGAPATIASRLAASEAARISLAAELLKTQRTLYIERARRAHTIPDEALEFVTAADEDGIMQQVALLARFARA